MTKNIIAISRIVGTSLINLKNLGEYSLSLALNLLKHTKRKKWYKVREITKIILVISQNSLNDCKPMECIKMTPDNQDKIIAGFIM